MTTHRSPVTVLPLALVAGTVLLAVAACGGDAEQTPSSAGPTGAATTAASAAPTSSSTSTSTTASTTAAAPSSGGPTSGSGAGAVCSVKTLKITYADDKGGGGAGSVVGALTFTNTGSSACTLAGFPGVSYVGGGNGTQVGQPATRTDDAVRMRTLEPGRRVKAVLRRTQPGNYGDDCRQTKVDGFRVYPPSSTDAAFVAFRTTGCKSTTAPLLQVGPVG